MTPLLLKHGARTLVRIFSWTSLRFTSPVGRILLEGESTCCGIPWGRRGIEG